MACVALGLCHPLGMGQGAASLRCSPPDGCGFSGGDSDGAFVLGSSPASVIGRLLLMLNNDGMPISQTGGENCRLVGFGSALIARPQNPLPNAAEGELWFLAETMGASIGRG